MSGRFSQTAAKARSRASAPSSLPGSVMTAKRAGSGWRSQAQARWLRVSNVEPDLDAATCSVRSGDSSAARRAIAAGSVVSRTCSAGPAPGATPWASTSGKRLEPPMPMTSTWSTPAATRLAILLSASRPVTMSGTTVSQPRRSATSVGSSRQRVWSADQALETALSSVSSDTAALTGEASGPRRSGVSSRITHPCYQPKGRSGASRASRSSTVLVRGAMPTTAGVEQVSPTPQQLAWRAVASPAQATGSADAGAQPAAGARSQPGSNGTEPAGPPVAPHAARPPDRRLGDWALLAITAALTLPVLWLGYGTD